MQPWWAIETSKIPKKSYWPTFFCSKKSRKLNYNGVIWFLCNRVLCRSRQIRCCFENVTWNAHYTTLLVEKGHKKTRKQKAREERIEKRTKTKRKQVRQNTAAEAETCLALSLSLFLSQHSSSQHDGAPRGPPAPVPHSEISELLPAVTGPLLAIHLNTTSLSRDCAGVSSVCILHCLRAGVPDLGNVCAHNDKNSQRQAAGD